ncbi:hypothetical protein [Streptomyces sp. NPDC046821]|uniref:hypothetical protein n=1 Tax=Streptomyces sp. NPDC046821 TaxID=3154702 RepID=UPI0033D74ED8
MRNPLAATGLHRYTRQQLAHDRDAARAEVLRLDGVIRGLDQKVIALGNENEQLRADAVDVSVERQLRQAAEDKASQLEEQLRALKAADANRNRITVPPVPRDIDSDDKATVPAGVNVRTLRAAFNPAVA